MGPLWIISYGFMGFYYYRHIHSLIEKKKHWNILTCLFSKCAKTMGHGGTKQERRRQGEGGREKTPAVLTPHPETNSKRTQGLSVKANVIHLQERPGESLWGAG